jgi:hypothetical protein
MERLMNIDRRLIFACVLLGVAVPLLVEFSFPVKPTPTVRAVYEQFEKVAARENGVVLLSFAYGAGTEPEMQPMAGAILRHCFSRGIKVVAVCLWPDAPGLAQEVLESAAAQFGKQYGVDYAFMGYKPGTYSVILNMGQDFHGAFPTDAWGARSDTLSLTSSILTLRDFDLVFDLAAGDSIEFWWIPFGQEKFGFAFAGGCTAVMAPDLFPFLQSGQMFGLIGGLAGAAEYEALVKHPGSATDGMRPQSITHLIIIAFILFGNTAFFLTRWQAGRSTRR